MPELTVPVELHSAKPYRGGLMMMSTNRNQQHGLLQRTASCVARVGKSRGSVSAITLLLLLLAWWRSVGLPSLRPPAPLPNTLSVVVAVHRPHLHYVQRLLHLLANQTRPPDEVVLAVNWDHEEDHRHLVRGWTDTFPHLVLSPSTGFDDPATSRNRGARAATSRILAFWDADDIPHPRKLEVTMVLLAAHPEVVLLLHKYRIFINHTRPIPFFEDLPRDPTQLVVRNNSWLDSMEHAAHPLPYIRPATLSKGLGELAHGWPTVWRDVALRLPFVETRAGRPLVGEDCLFVRQVAAKHPILYVEAVLGGYYRRREHEKVAYEEDQLRRPSPTGTAR